MQIDIAIPVSIKDLPKLQICINMLELHSITSIRHFYIIAQSASFLDGVTSTRPIIWINEAIYPFTKPQITEYLGTKKSAYSHASWYYQQLLKLYIFQVLPDLLPQVLIFDADYALLSNISFLTEDGRALFAYGYPFTWTLNGSEYTESFTHSHIAFAKRLVAGWMPMHRFSGMQHHMLVHKDLMQVLFTLVETHSHQPFWRAFLQVLDVEKWNAASEYVLYHHFVLKWYPHRVQLRHLKAGDILYDSKDESVVFDDIVRWYQPSGLDAIGYHAFLDLRERIQTMDYIPSALKQSLLDSPRLMFQLLIDSGRLQLNAVNTAFFEKGRADVQ